MKTKKPIAAQVGLQQAVDNQDVIDGQDQRAQLKKELHYERELMKKQMANEAKLVTKKCSSPHAAVAADVAMAVDVSVAAKIATASAGKSSATNVDCKAPKQLNPVGKKTQVTPTVAKTDFEEDACSGYNSGDEHESKQSIVSLEEWNRRDEVFAESLKKLGFQLVPVIGDGACLFRSISLQMYGDEGKHDVVRQQTMDYIDVNRDYFGQFITENIHAYLKRKRLPNTHGNHVEIQAMSEMLGRGIEVYCYKLKPINIFNSRQSQQTELAPMRLSYQRGSHYNAIVDPTVSLDLDLAVRQPKLPTKPVVRLSEQAEMERSMFEKMMKTSDWEATHKAIEAQIASDSYLQWCYDNKKRARGSDKNSSIAIYSSDRVSGSSGSGSSGSGSGSSSSSSSISSSARSKSNYTASNAWRSSLKHRHDQIDGQDTDWQPRKRSKHAIDIKEQKSSPAKQANTQPPSRRINARRNKPANFCQELFEKVYGKEKNTETKLSQ